MHILLKHKKSMAGLELATQKSNGEINKTKDRVITLDKDDLRMYPVYHTHSE